MGQVGGQLRMFVCHTALYRLAVFTVLPYTGGQCGRYTSMDAIVAYGPRPGSLSGHSIRSGPDHNRSRMDSNRCEPYNFYSLEQLLSSPDRLWSGPDNHRQYTYQEWSSILITYIYVYDQNANVAWMGFLTTIFPSLRSPTYCFPPCNFRYHWKEEINTFQKTYTLSWFFLMDFDKYYIFGLKWQKCHFFDSPSTPHWPGLWKGGKLYSFWQEATVRKSRADQPDDQLLPKLCAEKF